MPTYIYQCNKDRNHPTIEATHGMFQLVLALCDECGSFMHRVPQPHSFYFNPHDIHLDWMDENYRRYRARKAGKNAPPFSPDRVNRPNLS